MVDQLCLAEDEGGKFVWCEGESYGALAAMCGNEGQCLLVWRRRDCCRAPGVMVCVCVWLL